MKAISFKSVIGLAVWWTILWLFAHMFDLANARIALISGITLWGFVLALYFFAPPVTTERKANV